MPTLKKHENPLLTAISISESWARSEPKYLYSTWKVFAGYVTSKYVDQARNSAKRYVEGAEKGARIIVKKLATDRTPSDDLVEAATLVYFVLASEGVDRMYRMEEALSKAFTMCVEDAVSVDPRRSPALSRCLGLSYVLPHTHQLVEDLSKSCLGGSAEALTDFCTYAYFAKALNALLRKDEAVAESVAKWARNSLRISYMPAHLLALNMVSYGLASMITSKEKEDLAVRMKFFDRLNKKVLKGLKPLKIRRINRHVWVLMKLAITVNRLRHIEYVPEDYVVLPRAILTKIQSLLKNFEELVYKANLIVGLPITIASVVCFIITPPPHIPVLVGLIVGIYLVLTRFILKLSHRDVKEVKDELKRYSSKQV